jgi:predicted outer membrane lipoprotein
MSTNTLLFTLLGLQIACLFGQIVAGLWFEAYRLSRGFMYASLALCAAIWFIAGGVLL